MHSMYRGRVSHHHRGAMMTTAAHSTFTAAGRTYGGQRDRFVLGTIPEGASEVTLGDGEVATVMTDADGNVTVTIENKPTNGNGNGEPAPAPMAGEPITTSFVGHLAHGIKQRMSWVKEPGGEVVITPDDGETLFVTGDAVQAVVTAQPSTPG